LQIIELKFNHILVLERVMHPVNDFTSTSELPGVVLTPDQKPNDSLPFAPWIPVLALVAVLAIVSVLGSADKPSDDAHWLNRMANAGDSDAQLQLGLDYRDGRLGLAQDPAKGLIWLQRSAKQRNAYAEDALGSMYANGIGTKKDSELAMQWWRKSMDDGNYTARLHLSEALIEEGKVKQGEALLR